jgi:hypothetical protein
VDERITSNIQNYVGMIQKYDSMNPRVGLQIRGRGKTTSTDDKVKHKYRGKKSPTALGGEGDEQQG